jgi:outer membrane receptor protein involved in Fe transport
MYTGMPSCAATAAAWRRIWSTRGIVGAFGLLFVSWAAPLAGQQSHAPGATTSADSAEAVHYLDSVAGPAARRGAHRDTIPPDSAARKDSLARASATARLGTVTVTATPVQRSQPVGVVRVTSAMIAQAPSNSPYELLRQTAGVEAHEQGQGPGFASDVSIRGFSSDHSTDVALWIDGVPINEPVNGHAEGYNDFSLLFPQAVSEIDVIKGPTSALYGNFAFSGVVNVRTLEHVDATRVELSAGNFGTYDGALLTGFDHGGTRAVLGLRATHEDGWRRHAEDQIGQLHGRYLHDLSRSTTLDAGVELYATTYNSPGFLDTASYLRGHDDIVSNFGDGGFKRRAQERVSLRAVLSPNLTWRSTLYSTQGTWNFWLSTPPGLGGLLEGSGVETREYDGRYGGGATSALTYTGPRVQATLGGETRFDHAHYENWGEAASAFRQDSVQFGLAHAHQLSAGLFAQSSFDVTPHLRVDLGARLDQLSSATQTPDSTAALVSLQHSKGMFSPKTGLLFRVLPWAGLYANISRGFRQADGVIFDPRVPFITVWNYETGVKIDRGPLSLDATLFRMDLSNEQAFNGVTTISGGPSRRRGVDVSARATVTPAVAVTTTFTVLDARYTRFFDAKAGIDYSGRPVFNTSRVVGAAGVEVAPPHAIWRARLATNFQGAYTPFEEAVGLTRPAFALVHASGGIRLGSGAELDFGLRNVLDTQYRELESGYFITPGQPRTVYVSARYDIF